MHGHVSGLQGGANLEEWMFSTCPFFSPVVFDDLVEFVVF
jgi:hypothetical protein